jgi:hypothetical protein
MKKVLFGLFSIAISLSSFAQIKNDKGTFTKPGAGEYVFETQMRADITGAGALFSLNDAFLSNLSAGMNPDVLDGFSSKAYYPMLKVRKFKSNNSAERYGFNLSYSTQKDKVNISGSEGSDTYTDFGLAVSYGMEKHFAGAERLSTYVGADATLGLTMNSYKGQNGTTTTKQSQTGFGIGVKAFTGMDYYFIPKVYLGLELGYGIGFNSYGKTKTGSTDDGTTKSEFTLTPFVSPTFRLGYRF